jgi:two-component system nitrogen regulation response regulator NtrX
LKEMAVGAVRMIGASLAFQKVLEQATLAARSDARVLLSGESGTGKELLAAHIHASSPFSGGPFIKVNCAAIPTELIESELFGHEKGSFTGATAARRGKFELADSGTLFLDECGDLHASSQAKLLRVLQEGEFHRVGGEQPVRVSVRVIAATNRDLWEMVAQQKFREDLYYRLCVVPVRVPALRERREDIRPLADYFLADFCARNNFRARTFEPQAIDALEQYSWPGNIRELRNVVERMAILSRGDVLESASVPLEIRIPKNHAARGNLRETRESAEREHILRALEEAQWNVSGAARALGMERTNLHKRIKALGIGREK